MSALRRFLKALRGILPPPDPRCIVPNCRQPVLRQAWRDQLKLK